MPYSVDYFNARVQNEIERWPVGFVKKTQATPERELKIARKRMKEVRGG